MAFGNWRAKFKAESQPLVRKLLYGRQLRGADRAVGTRGGGGDLHVIGETFSEMLDHVSARPASGHPHLPALI
jgi:hypothetical protein